MKRRPKERGGRPAAGSLHAVGGPEAAPGAGAREAMVLERLRSMCLPLPGVSETLTDGNRTFRVGERGFAVLDTWPGTFSLAIKAGLEHAQALLANERFYRTPYIGQHGWVSLKLDGAVDWRLLHGLLLHSFRQVAPARTRRLLDGG